MVLGIGIFFACLVSREQRYAEEPDEVALLLEEVAAEEKRNAFHREREHHHEESHGEEHAETLDPWERPADWWKRSNED
jgi:ABC-type nickel/cobalt efflux system permease component RcnA